MIHITENNFKHSALCTQDAHLHSDSIRFIFVTKVSKLSW